MRNAGTLIVKEYNWFKDRMWARRVAVAVVLAVAAGSLLTAYMGARRNFAAEGERFAALSGETHSALCQKLGKVLQTPEHSGCVNDLKLLQGEHEKWFAQQHEELW